MGTEIKSIYTLKVLLVILIVGIHTGPFFGETLDSYLLPIMRIGVPCFFIISGYFFGADSYEKLRSHVLRSEKKLLRLAIISTLLYFCFSLYSQGISGSLAVLTNVKSYVHFFLLNTTFFGRHLWYFFAYIYVLVAFLVLYRKNLRFIKVEFCIILFIIGLGLSTYGWIFHLGNLPQTVSRNWLFTGLPFFIVGFIIRKQQWATRFTTRQLVIWAILFCATSIIEGKLLDGRCSGDMFLSTGPAAVFTFLLFEKNRTWGKDAISKIGKKYSLGIYVVHVALADLFMDFLTYEHRSLAGTFWYVVPIILIFSFVLSWLLRLTKVLV